MDILAAVFRQSVREMTEAQRREALEYLIGVIDAEIMGHDQADDVETCPRCGCPETSRNGHQGGYQRRICKGCGQSFSPRTLPILGETKLGREVWAAYARCMVGGRTLRECAARCGVSLKTSFFMRHRVCEMMEAHLDRFRVGEGCSAEVDEYYLHESLSGNHAKGAFEMPRKPHKRGSDVRKRGVSNESIGVLTGVNDHGDCFCQVVCRGYMSAEAARGALAGRVCEGSIVSTDRHRSYKAVLPELGVAVHNAYDPKDRSEGTINSVNSLHSRLTAFLRPFNSVSTRRLPNYLTWFQWLESFKKLDTDAMRGDLAVKQVGRGYYKTTWREYRDTPYPFGDYYGWGV